ncbi:MAG TPA: NADH-quinone oxidoreductase subunit J, partial [Candidatus Binatia bacterium]|nr:NADH-quinone oxidoreductase subunit J [Candidatus Binatia bacterium]
MYFFFFLFAIVGLFSAIMVITRKNVMHAALFLLLTFACVGATYVLLRAELLAAVQVLVYAGAVTVLFLFAILLVNIPRVVRLRQWNRQTAVAVIIAGLTGLWLIIATTRAFGKLELPAGAADQPLGTPRAIGQLLFADYMVPFENASLILLAAMVGAIFLARETALEEERAVTDTTTPEPVERPQSTRQLV